MAKLTPEEKARREARLAMSPQEVLEEARQIKAIAPNATAQDQASGKYADQLKKKPVVQEVQPAQPDYMQQLIDMQRKQQLAALEQARAQTLSSLEAEATGVGESALAERSGIRAQGQKAARSFGEYLAARGLSTSGTGVQAQIAQNVTTGQGISGSLGREQSQLADIERRRGLAEQQFALGQQQLESGLAQQQLEYQMGQQEQAKQDYLTTIGRFGRDYQAEIDRVQNDGDPTNDWQIPYLQAARQEKIVAGNLDPVTGQPLTTVPTLTSSSAMQLWEQLGTANESVSQALGIPVGTRYTQAVTGGRGGGGISAPPVNIASQIAGYESLKNALSRGRLSGIEAINFIADNYQNLSEQYGRNIVDAITEELQTGRTPTTEPVVEQPEVNLKPYQNVIEDSFFSKDLYGAPIVDREGIASYISTITDPNVASQLSNIYGITQGVTQPTAQPTQPTSPQEVTDLLDKGRINSEEAVRMLVNMGYDEQSVRNMLGL